MLCTNIDGVEPAIDTHSGHECSFTGCAHPTVLDFQSRWKVQQVSMPHRSPENSSRRGVQRKVSLPMSISLRALSGASRFYISLFALAVAASFFTNSASTSSNSPEQSSITLADSTVSLPDRSAGFDYQLGGAYVPPPGVTVVERDRTDAPSGAGYDICYVNGFQTQPDESETFFKQHPELIVQVGGKPFVDPGWPDEYIFDTSTPAKRAALAATVQPWIAGCKTAGYTAVEIDNLDSFTRAGDFLTADGNIALAAEYAKIAHAAGLAIAQKNTVEQTARLRSAGYDFAITESCFYNEECDGYTGQYPVVLDVEYTDELGRDAFAAACKSGSRPPVMIMRDKFLVAKGSRGYFYQSCKA